MNKYTIYYKRRVNEEELTKIQKGGNLFHKIFNVLFFKYIKKYFD